MPESSPPSNTIDKSQPDDPQPQVGVSTSVEVKTEFRGPIPDPLTLAEYDRLHPGLADRLVQMAERQAAHRHKMEVDILRAQAADEKAERSERLIGQIFALTIGLSACATTVTLGYLDHPASATIFGTAGIASLVGVFLHSRQSRHDAAS